MMGHDYGVEVAHVLDEGDRVTVLLNPTDDTAGSVYRVHFDVIRDDDGDVDHYKQSGHGVGGGSMGERMAAARLVAMEYLAVHDDVDVCLSGRKGSSGGLGVEHDTYLHRGRRKTHISVGRNDTALCGYDFPTHSPATPTTEPIEDAPAASCCKTCAKAWEGR